MSDDEWTVRLTEAERRATVGALTANLAQCRVEIERLQAMSNSPAEMIIESIRAHVREVRRVLAKVEEPR